MRVFVTFESSLQELNLFFTLHAFAFCIRTRLLIAVSLVEFDHLLDTLLVLHFNLQFEFKLMKHAGDLRGGVGGVGLDQV